MKFKEELKDIGRNIYFYDSLGSTNDQARILATEGADHGSLVITEPQNGGRGRRGRSFFSPEGVGIWMSMILKPDIAPEKASMLTLVAAVAVQETMEDFGISSGIKWPNDLVVDGKKITGILTEMSAEPDHIHHIILGIGINVNMTEFPEELRETATSMTMATGKTYSRSEIIRRFLLHFDVNYDIFIKTGDLSFIKESYNERLIHKDKEIRVHEIGRVWRGISRGITDTGELIVTSEDGDIPVRSGEVSIRGVYGYME